LTPVVVSSDTPRMAARVLVKKPGVSFMRLAIWAKRISSSSLPGLDSTSSPASARAPIRMYMVASPPSSRIMFDGWPSGHWKMRSV